MARNEIEQRADDDFRRKLCGLVCFCGAHDSPLMCLAHGYCHAHATPAHAQMSADDKARLAQRIGVKL